MSSAPGAASAAVPAAPVGGGDRIDDIDIIRGLALCGVLLANLLEVFRVPLFDLSPEAHAKHGALVDRAAEFVLHLFISGKAITAFSFLFGVGMAVFLERAARRTSAPLRLLARRLGVLFVLGAIHLILIWDGDILTCYAVAGFLALPLLRRGPRAQLIAVVVLAILADLVWLRAVRLMPRATMIEFSRHAIAGYRSHGYGGVLAFRVRTATPLQVALSLILLPRTLALFLLGALAWSRGVLRAPGEHLRLLRWVALVGLGGGFLTSLVEVLRYEGAAGLTSWYRLVPTMAAEGLGYVAALLLLLRRPWWRRLLAPIAPLGRMALTNYLTQSIVWGFVFYGYGLGLMGKPGVAVTALAGLVLYALQIVVSRWWLARFQFGPFEWLWRSLTYGRWQPLRGRAR